MNSVKIFEALGEVDDELVERADRPLPHQNRHEIVKRMLVIAACLALVVSISVGGAMMFGHKDVEVPENPGADNGAEEETKDSISPYAKKNFSTLDEFEAYIYDESSQDKDNDLTIFPENYIDFSSIIPADEWKSIVLHGKRTHSYESSYQFLHDSGLLLYFIHSKSPKTTVRYSGVIEDDFHNEPIYQSLTEIENIEKQGYYRFNIGGNEIIYGIKPNDKRVSYYIAIVVEDFHIEMVGFCAEDPETDAQSELYKALAPQYGATDESIIEMLDKIKALIPQ